MGTASDPSLCPSGAAEQPGAKVFAIVGVAGDGAAGYLDQTVPVNAEVLALAAPLSPANVYRVAVPCAAKGCIHFEGGACQIAERLLRHAAPVSEALPRCAIRPACRWWRGRRRRLPPLPASGHNAARAPSRGPAAGRNAGSRLNRRFPIGHALC